MDTPRLPEEPRAPLTADVLSEPQTVTVTAAIQALLAGETIQDAGDRRHIAEALEFMEASTQNLPDIARHASSIGEVMGGYDMQGMSIPPEIDALNRHFQTLLCQHHLSNAAAALEQVPPNLPEARRSAQLALDFAKTFSKGYHDDTLLNQALALQQRIGQP